MRTPVMAGNWKMHMDAAGAERLARSVVGAGPFPDVEVILAPPAPYLPVVAESIAGSAVRVAGQDMHWAEEGAFTGAVSPAMVAEYGDAAIVGHSERREHFGEDDDDVNRKVHAAFHHDLQPIVCVGERPSERDAGQTDEVVQRQVGAAFEGLAGDEAPRVIVAYEPVWAIGSGQACEPDEANRVAGLIRRVIDEEYPGAGGRVRVLYGGSVKPNNVEGFMREEGIDGALVGGASLKADSFVSLIEAARSRVREVAA